MATIKDLKKAIKNLPDDMRVDLEGCDCTGIWSGEIDTYDLDNVSVAELARGGEQSFQVLPRKPAQPEWASDIPIGDLP